jgi:hypothetical protein
MRPNLAFQFETTRNKSTIITSFNITTAAPRVSFPNENPSTLKIITAAPKSAPKPFETDAVISPSIDQSQTLAEFNSNHESHECERQPPYSQLNNTG